MRSVAIDSTAISREPPRIGGRYALGPPLGRGGMGEVVRGYDHHLERAVAIKRAHPRACGHLAREARIAARIAHRAVVQVYDLVDDGGVAHLVLELVEGPSLFARRAGTRLAPREVVHVLRELAGGLAAIHARGAVHLDLKLENVLVAADGQPKITDFGIARALADDEPGDPSRLIGTPRVMSPEQIQGEAVDARSDLYSLGVLAYELLAGASPFAGGDELQTIARVLADEPPMLAGPDLPPALARLVADLLEKPPALRPQSAREVEVRLHAIAIALRCARACERASV